MKRVFALLLALLMLFSLAACSSDEDGEEQDGSNMAVTNTDLVYRPAENPNGEEFFYEYVNADEVRIVGYRSNAGVQHAVTVPAKIDQLDVTAIGNDAFKSCTNITAVNLPDTVTTVGASAFYGCTSLLAVKMPAALHTIGDIAFAGCTKLTTVSITADLTQMGVGAFQGCTALATVSLPATLVKLPKEAFMDCTALTTVNWSASGTEIGAFAFADCANLENFAFPATLEQIGEYAFAGCAKQAVPTLAMIVDIGPNAFYGASAN